MVWKYLPHTVIDKYLCFKYMIDMEYYMYFYYAEFDRKYNKKITNNTFPKISDNNNIVNDFTHM